jgi:hypothetical protein
MIPNDVVVIAEILALEYKGSTADWQRYEKLAWKIYNQLQLEHKAEANIMLAPDD